MNEDEEQGWLLRLEQKLEQAGPLVYLILVTVAALVGAVLLYFVIHQQHQIRRESSDIQAERVASVTRSCLDQNTRHGAAVTALYALLKKSGVPKAKRDASAAPILSLIDALAPKQNCDQVVAAALSSQAPSPRAH